LSFGVAVLLQQILKQQYTYIITSGCYILLQKTSFLNKDFIIYCNSENKFK